MSSNSWKPNIVAQIQKKEVLCFSSWDAAVETSSEVNEQVGILLRLCFSANILERGNHAAMFIIYSALLCTWKVVSELSCDDSQSLWKLVQHREPGKQMMR